MKIRESILSTVRTAYAYPTAGTVTFVLVHEERHSRTGVKVEYATVHQSSIKARFTGRLVIHRRGALRVALSATQISAEAPTIDGGSENTKSRNIPVGHVSFVLGPDQYCDAYHVNLMDGLISTDFTYQPDCADEIDPTHDTYSWAGYQIVKSDDRRAA